MIPKKLALGPRSEGGYRFSDKIMRKQNLRDGIDSTRSDRALKASKPTARPERVKAFRLGLSAESRAALLLIAKGYRILARRWKTPFGEIDIVARRRGVLVFVEVKARERLDDAAEAVTERTKHRIVSAAELWRARNPEHANSDTRFDVIVVTPGKMPRHIINAFNPGG
jgi:putative endonuclease